MSILLTIADTCIDTMLLGTFCDNCEGGPILKIILMAVKILTIGFGILATIGIIVVGVQYMTARDNEGQLARAKKRLIDIIIGIGIYGLMYLILELLTPGNIMTITPDVSTSTCSNPTVTTPSPINGGPISGSSTGSSSGSSSSTSSGTSSSGTSSQPVGSTKAEQLAINAVSAAWPYTSGEHAGKCKTPAGSWVSWNKKKVYSDDTKYCGYSLKPENEAIYKSAYKKSSINDSYFKSHVQDCVYFLKAVVVYTGMDTKSSFPSSPTSQRNYLAKSKKWKEITNNGNTKNLQPGDVFANSTHVMIYVGKYGSPYGDMVGASARTWSARIHSAYFKNSKSGEKFRIFRYIGD
jgi:hypothetical protein